MLEEIDEVKDVKLYSQRAIGIATFLGGPLAAGYLIRENYVKLGKQEEGNKSFLIGVFATVLLFTAIFLIPDSIIDKIPNQIFPIIYTTIVYVIVEQIHGEILRKHKENGKDFYSAWRATGIGFISAIVLMVGIFGMFHFAPEGEEIQLYNNGISKFSQNETESLVFYDHLDIKTDDELLKELETVSIPKWEENIKILKKTSTIENLPNELVEQNKELLKYSELRLKAFELFRKSISRNTTIYQTDLEQVHNDIEEQLEKLN